MLGDTVIKKMNTIVDKKIGNSLSIYAKSSIFVTITGDIIIYSGKRIKRNLLTITYLLDELFKI